MLSERVTQTAHVRAGMEDRDGAAPGWGGVRACLTARGAQGGVYILVACEDDLALDLRKV